MKPYFETDAGVIHQGHVLEVLKSMEVESVHVCVTSPPYWGLRDYDLPPQIWGGDSACDHVWGDETIKTYAPKRDHNGVNDFGDTRGLEPSRAGFQTELKQGQFCQRCNAWLGSFGLEPTPELYIEHTVEIFRGVWRVLRKDGTVWINLGDSYAGGGGSGSHGGGYRGGHEKSPKAVADNPMCQPNRMHIPGLKPKDLCMIPARVALALQADGWWLRQDIIEEVEVYCPHCGWQLEERIWRHGQDREIIWKKPNSMPESVTDRCTKSHEYIFLLTKSAKYFYDAEAIKEDVTGNAHPRGDGVNPKAKGREKGKIKQNESFSAAVKDLVSKRNKRSVWTIPTHPMPEAHFATFPPKLIEPCILAGTSEKGCCKSCGANWVRVVEKTQSNQSNAAKAGTTIIGKGHVSSQVRENHDIRNGPCVESKTIGWEPGCRCNMGYPGFYLSPDDDAYVPCNTIPCTVLDPFGGSMTTAIVAYKHGRKFIMIELSKTYIDDIGIPRIEKETKQLKLWN